MIDPLILVYSTFLGGVGYEEGCSIAVDKDGCAYVTRFTKTADFPVKNAKDSTYNGDQDVFITKFAAG